VSGPDAIQPAPLLRRLGAVGLDYLVVSAYLVVLVLIGLAVSGNPGLADALFGGPLIGELVGFIVLTLPVTLYFGLSEASPRGATIGKRGLGLRVVTLEGERLSVGRSLVRSATKFLPWELAHAAVWQFAFAGPDDQLLPTMLLVASWSIVGVSVALTLLDPRRRSLHDRVAGSIVIPAGDIR
jgi:uncharacterized RDD family membrane protein YckC